MKYILLLTLLMSSSLLAEQLKIKADTFSADQSKGISVFKGNVNIIKNNDELNASKVTIYTDKKNQPTKFIAVGDVSFKIQTDEKSRYQGRANRVVYKPLQKEYYFYKNVVLKQMNEKKEIAGDEVVLNTRDGRAYAKGLEKKPVIMIFDIPEAKKE